MSEEIDDFLAHYGVKGMKWGKRKSEDKGAQALKTPEEIAAAKAARKKKLIIAGSVAAGVVLIAAGTYGAVKYNQKRNLNIKLDLERRLDEKHDINWKPNDKLKGEKTLSQIKKDVVDPINPNFGQPGTKINCMRATFAYELRRRGYDVRATLAKTDEQTEEQTEIGRLIATTKLPKNSSHRGMPLTSMHETFKHVASPDRLSSAQKMTLLGEKRIIGPQEDRVKTAKAVIDALSKEPNGARGEIGIGWFFGGHSMAWENVNGKPVIIDAQNGRVYDDLKKITKAMARADGGVGYTRFDDKEINFEFLERWLTDA